ncbi:MAG: PAS domain-containing protein [Nitrospirota bacterium]|nr:MAG: PAS domain-containing protein [Nitrospirota bacterium]
MKFSKISKRVIVCAFSVSLVFPLIVFFILAPLIDSILIKESTEEAFRVAEHLGSEYNIQGRNFSSESFPEDLKEEIEHLKGEFGLYKISIFSDNGEIVYSTNSDEVGIVISSDMINEKLVEGNRYSEFVKQGEISIEGYPISADTIEAYLPLMVKGQYAGAIEVYYDITDAREDFLRLKIAISVVLFLVGFVMLSMITMYSSKIEESKELKNKAEVELSREQLKTEAVFAAMGDNVIVQDRDFRIIFQNEVNKRTFGDRKGEYCYKVYEGLDDICDGCPVELTYQDGKIHGSQRIMDSDDGTRYYDMVSSPLFDEKGEVIAGVKVVRDVTDRKNLEEQLLQSQKLEAIGTLTGGISHEFNNILTAMHGFAEMLKDEVEKGSVLENYVDGIYESTLRAMDLTQGLLTYSRKHPVNIQPVNVNEFIRSRMEFLRRIVGIDIEFEFKLLDDEGYVMIDLNQFEQILVNLIANAKDAMRKAGKISIETEKYEMDDIAIETFGFGARGVYMLIKVKDNGTGMEPHIKEKIFEPFYTTKDVGKGTGLGLSIVYGIVKRHNGYIYAESSVGKGTTFMILLPFIDENSIP